MKPHEEPGNPYARLVQACALGAGAIGLLVLLTWLTGGWKVGAFGHDNVPMPPSSACLMVFFSARLLLVGRGSARKEPLKISVPAALADYVMSLAVWVGVSFCFEFGVERWLVPVVETPAGISIGRMSPLTASSFLFAALALMLDLPPFGGSRASRQTASLLALVPLLVGSTVLLSYTVGAPAVYGGRIVPMSLLTAVSFMLVGLGLLVSAGPDTWLVGLLATRSPGGLPRPSGAFVKNPWIIFLLLCAVIVTAMHFYAKRQIDESRRRIQDDLASIADSKVKEIVDWYEDSLADAQALFTTPIVRSRVREFLAGPGLSGPARDLLNWIKTVRRVCQYRLVVLYDAKGASRLVIPQDTDLQDIENDPGLRAALGAEGLITTDLHQNQRAGGTVHGDVHMDCWIPIGLDTGAHGVARGVWLVQIDPRVFLYPLIQSWPTASRTAETLLVRRDGDDVLFLNELHHRKNTALSLRLPISTESLPAAVAALGHEVVMEGIDYRGMPVLAATRRIPGTPWFIVAKVDQDEVYAPLRERARTLAAVLIAVVLMTGLAVSVLQRRRDQQWLERYLAGERFRQFATTLLKGLNQQTAGRGLLEEIMQMVKGFMGVEAIGIRLRQEEDFPYFVTTGFPEGFVEAETSLCSRDKDGGLIRDSNGNPYLECMCGNVIQGRTDPELPFFTENGSFWTNSTTEFIANTALNDRRPGTRNRCNTAGYESLALIPLRIGKETIGLMQLNDKRPGRHSLEMVQFLEEMGSSIGIAVERVRLEEEIRESERRYRAVVEDQVDLICRLDPDSRYVFVTDAFCRFFGQPKEALVGRHWFAEVHPDDLNMVREKMAGMSPSEPVITIENRVFSGTGALRWMQFVNRGLYDSVGRLIEIQVVARDITERKDSEARLNAAFLEKETLLREIQHRVKNNLQSVIALVQMRSPKVWDEGARRILDEVQAQVRAMSLVYEQLFEAGNLSRVAMGPYLKNLAMNVVESLGRGRAVEFAVDVSDEYLNLAAAMPCGLIVNELLTNAFKYAWPAGFEGRRRFEISLRRRGEKAFELRVADNGVGIPAEVTGAETGSMGMKLVRLWATHQLGGTITFELGQGTTVQVVFEPRFDGGAGHGQD